MEMITENLFFKAVLGVCVTVFIVTMISAAYIKVYSTKAALDSCLKIAKNANEICLCEHNGTEAVKFCK